MQVAPASYFRINAYTLLLFQVIPLLLAVAGFQSTWSSELHTELAPPFESSYSAGYGTGGLALEPSHSSHAAASPVITSSAPIGTGWQNGDGWINQAAGWSNVGGASLASGGICIATITDVLYN